MINVVKIGGNVIDNPDELQKFVQNFSSLSGNKILVHGGGKEATKLSKSMGLEPRMINGRRVTDADTLNIVIMIYAGLINKRIVSMLQSCGCNAIGLSGADGNLLTTVRRPPEPIDYGFVGDVTDGNCVNSALLNDLVNAGYTPVICAITHDGNGQLLNTNADTVASAIATGLVQTQKVTLTMCFELNGVLADVNDAESLINEISIDKVDILKSEGIISGGMIPKIDNAVNAVKRGVAEVSIVNHKNIGAGKCKGTIIR